eukprot:COSAG02_NODE_4718_length_5059_cov_6.717540_2_plen_274_part_00
MSTSTDGGTTFGACQPAPALIGPVCQATMVTVPTRQGLAIFHANPGHGTDKESKSPPDGRASGTVRRSVDGGKTWEASTVLNGHDVSLPFVPPFCVSIEPTTECIDVPVCISKLTSTQGLLVFMPDGGAKSGLHWRSLRDRTPWLCDQAWGFCEQHCIHVGSSKLYQMKCESLIRNHAYKDTYLGLIHTQRRRRRSHPLRLRVDVPPNATGASISGRSLLPGAFRRPPHFVQLNRLGGCVFQVDCDNGHKALMPVITPRLTGHNVRNAPGIIG